MEADVPLVQHTYFDSSIAAYFADGDPAQPQAQDWDKAILEGVLRYAGITAFPINGALYDAQEGALLGLRFDTLAHSTGKYNSPHYIVLRWREAKLGAGWTIFRYTTPAHLPLEKLAKLLPDLQRFCEGVRKHLVWTQYRLDKCAQLARIDNVSVDHDLAASRIVVSAGALQLELICGANVERVRYTGPAAAARVETLLVDTPLVGLAAGVRRALAYLEQHNAL